MKHLKLDVRQLSSSQSNRLKQKDSQVADAIQKDFTFRI